MKQITLHPVRTNEWRNYWLRWPRSKQVLATMLLWASRAGANRITFDPSRAQPLVYSNDDLSDIESELPPPPEDVVSSFLVYLHRIANDNHWFGLVRPREQVFDCNSSVLIRVPDSETGAAYNWSVEVYATSATFKLKPQHESRY